MKKGDAPLVQVGLPQILQNFHAGFDGRFLRSPTHVCTVQLVGAAGFEDIVCTDKNENHIILIYKEIQSGAVAKSYMRKGILIYGEMHKYFLIYEEAVSHI